MSKGVSFKADEATPVEQAPEVDVPERQRILGRKIRAAQKSDGVVRFAEGESVPVPVLLNRIHRLRDTKPVERTITWMQAWILKPLIDIFTWTLTNVFFREVEVVGLENVPSDGPVIFFGNHSNQFMDAIMMRAHCGREVRFIIAEKSMHRPIIGTFARAMGAVPVIRPQDVRSHSGTGKFASSNGRVITGVDTKFSTDLRVGDVVQWSVPSKVEKISAQVLTVDSDTQITMTMDIKEDDAITTPTQFQVSPRIDHSEMYAEVYNTLSNGGSIGIFPEGGSHDRTSLLPLKAGVALFALGAAERLINVRAVPVGLTYIYGHKFRSRAHVEFGKPIVPPRALVECFSTDKREATGQFLKMLDDALRDVTINTRDWATLTFVHNFRRLYQRQDTRLEPIDYLRLTRRLALLVEKHEKEPDVAEFRAKTENYLDFCNALLVRDAQAATLSQLQNVSVMLLLRRIATLCVLFIVLIPFFIIAGPIGVIAHIAAEAHARTALRGSSVKVIGQDVKASYKVISAFALIPLECTVIFVLTWLYTDFGSAVTTLVCVPMALYVSLAIVHEFVLEMYATLPLLMSLLSRHKQFMKLHQHRTRLVEAAKEIVAKYDPELQSEMSVYVVATTVANSNLSASAREPSLFSLRHRSRTSDQKKLM
jgi:glycerol-3-phosphate O-acyltransferase/dihydroxyacetone phosphate acyltransferase